MVKSKADEVASTLRDFRAGDRVRVNSCADQLVLGRVAGLCGRVIHLATWSQYSVGAVIEGYDPNRVIWFAPNELDLVDDE